MKQYLWRCSLLLTLLSGVCTAENIATNTSKKIKCHPQPMDLMPKGNLRRHKFKSKPFATAKSRAHLPFKLSASTNWSGYVAAQNIQHPKKRVVTAVEGCWRVPTLAATADVSISSTWVGIDGFARNSQTVEQIGTIQVFDSGTQLNIAFFEFFPGPAFALIGFPLNNNDRIRAKVKYEGNHIFKLTLINKTQKVFAEIKRKFKGAVRNSAEWIVEAPSDLGGNLFPLGNFGNIGFTECEATIDKKHGSISNPHWNYDSIWMFGITSDLTPLLFLKANPSALSRNGESFNITWRHE